MDANFFISRAEREFDSQNNRIILTARDRFHADGLRHCCLDVAKWAGGKDTLIHWSEDKGLPYVIPGNLACSAELENNQFFAMMTDSVKHERQKPQTTTSSHEIQLTLPAEPQSKDDELVIWAQLNKKPTGICSLTTGKVLFMNSLMPEFCGLAYDQIAVPDIATQFAKKDEREPTNLVEFNERLIKDKVINGSMKAFRTSGAFGNFHGKYTFSFLNGVPVRISEYDSFEVID
jgi:hypothetical protein